MEHRQLLLPTVVSLAAALAAGCLAAPDDGDADIDTDAEIDTEAETEVDTEIDTDAPLAETSQKLAHTTTPASLPNRLTLGHLDNAPGTNLLQFDQNRLFVTRSDYYGTPVMHHWYSANIVQLIVGDFSLPGTREHGHDQVCAILADGSMDCQAPSDDRTQLWWWFTQGNPLASGEKPIVGDFTGDGAQDILAFNAATGTVRLLSRTQTGYFEPVSAFAVGNLAGVDLRGKRLFAGEFGQATGRADLLVVDPPSGQVSRFDTATDTAGRTTFWWAFTTGGNAVLPGEQVTVANVDGGSRDGLLLRDPATGGIRAKRVEYQNGFLLGVPSSIWTPGQLPITTHSAVLVAAKIANHPGEPGQGRDDTLFFDRTNGTLSSTEARYDGSRYTYWWSYTKATPTQSGWAPRQDTSMAVILCKLADVSRTPDKVAIKRTLVGRGSGGLRDYLFHVTYGTQDIANANVYGWVTSTLKAADSSARGGKWKTADYIADCEARAGVSGSAFNGRVLVVLNDQNVSFQGINGFGATVDYAAVLGGDILGVAHETLHAFGLNHADDDTRADCGGGANGSYCDSADVMGSSTGPEPELNGGHRNDLGVIPATRVITLDPLTAPARTTIQLAPLEHPEAAGTLLIKVKTNGSGVYTVEYRRPVLLDAGTGVNGVQVHLSAGGYTTLQTYPAATLGAGATARAGAFTLHVDSIDAASGRAEVTLSR